MERMKNEHDIWMSHALLEAMKSKDPSTKVGAVIVEDGRIISTGRNGMVRGCANEKDMWKNKHPFVIHAEMNAALFSRKDYLGGCQVYTTLSPCINCLKHMFQLGVRVVYYAEFYYKHTAEQCAELLILIDSMNCSIVNQTTGRKYREELYEQMVQLHAGDK